MGVEKSEAMLEISGKKLTQEIRLMSTYDLEDILAQGTLHEHFDVITSMHVLDWIDDVEKALDNLVPLLKSKGIILFSVFPKSHVKDSLVIDDLFEDFDSTVDPCSGYCNFDGIRVPVFVKEPSYYDKYFASKNFEKVLEFYPPYPAEFLKKYKWTGSLYPEMVIFAYRKP
jgi:SAM-dependent methyltransferase